MCFGGGKSAEKIYQERKPKFGALPSVRMEPVDRPEQRLMDVRRRGMERRTLLRGYNNANG